MKLRDNSGETSGGSSILDSDEQCDVEDEDDCRCDGTGSRRKCCDASDDCEGELCCVDCERSERNDKDICKFCDERERNCMKMEDSCEVSSTERIEGKI